MATTRMRTSSSTTVFHRVGASDDMAEHDVGTSDANVSGLGGTGEFQIAANSTVTYADASKVQGTSEAPINGSSGTVVGQFLHIKHSGFTSADKDTTTAETLTVGIGGAFAAGGFTLASGEAITLHGLGAGSDDLNDIQLDSSSGNIYVEITYL